mmetsp:Transcript_36929/g.69029  ORF Transcript_36929/g.69029 Transcript_36929/m.69029 type:complete len:205 (-) Transcript_36929:98-712(-)
MLATYNHLGIIHQEASKDQSTAVSVEHLQERRPHEAAHEPKHEESKHSTTQILAHLCHVRLCHEGKDADANHGCCSNEQAKDDRLRLVHCAREANDHRLADCEAKQHPQVQRMPAEHALGTAAHGHERKSEKADQGYSHPAHVCRKPFIRGIGNWCSNESAYAQLYSKCCIHLLDKVLANRVFRQPYEDTRIIAKSILNVCTHV